MPVWHAKTKAWVAEGRLDVLGVTQEQHPERCRLFAQWQGLDWPILHDPINLLGNAAVPTIVVLDDDGIVREVDPSLETFEEEFLKPLARERPSAEVLNLSWTAHTEDRAELRADAEGSRGPTLWRRLGDACVLWGGADALDEAVTGYERSLEASDDATVRFRLGVALRMRHESPLARPGDFQRAVDAWTAALERNPNQYVWRRRIQQYGPRLRDKPYPFYDWVDEAAAAIEARGETPVELAVRPYGAELAAPARRFEPAPTAGATSPDPEGAVARDEPDRVAVEVTLVPPRPAPGAAVRVHVTLTPTRGTWNNEGAPLVLWVDPPAGWEVSRRRLEAPNDPSAAESREARRLDLEVLVPDDASGSGAFRVSAFYNACTQAGGACRYLRRDVAFDVPVLR